MGPSLPHRPPLLHQHLYLYSHRDDGGRGAAEGTEGQTWFMGRLAQHAGANPKWPAVALGAEPGGPEWQWRGGSPPPGRALGRASGCPLVLEEKWPKIGLLVDSPAEVNG